MSFTLRHYKDGVPQYIKMSIWDAFRGAPELTSKKKLLNVDPLAARSKSTTPKTMEPCKELAKNLVQCSCCHKVHLPQKPDEKEETDHKEETRNQAAGKDKQDKQDDAGDGAKDGKGSHSWSTREEETYSEADNEKIIKLKQEGKSWKEILEAIDKKSQSQLKAHWKTIDPNAQDGVQDNSKGNKKDNDSKKEETEQKKSTEQAKKKQNQEGQNKNAKSNNNSTSRKGSTNTTPEAKEMKAWSDRWDKQKWIAAASRHFDLTGQRITPEAARKLVER